VTDGNDTPEKDADGAPDQTAPATPPPPPPPAETGPRPTGPEEPASAKALPIVDVEAQAEDREFSESFDPKLGKWRRMKAFFRLFRRFVLGKFGWVFAVGVAMMTVWALMLFLIGSQGIEITTAHGDKVEMSKALAKMTFTQIFTGRASGIGVGKRLGLSMPWLIFTASYVDILVVMTIFPIIAFAYRHLARMGVFGEFARDAVEAAEESRPAVARWGMVGLFFFVIFPFYMTGPLIGAVIGFFIKLPLVLNLFVVISGTIAAIVGWVYVFEWIYNSLENLGGALGEVMPLAVVVMIVGLAVLIRVRSIMKTRNREMSGIRPAVGSGDAPPADGQAEPEEKPEGGA